MGTRLAFGIDHSRLLGNSLLRRASPTRPTTWTRLECLLSSSGLLGEKLRIGIFCIQDRASDLYCSRPITSGPPPSQCHNRDPAARGLLLFGAEAWHGWRKSLHRSILSGGPMIPRN
jgi:hypothetical protein